MPQSLRSRLKKLNHDGKITEDELYDLLKKLDGHDAKNNTYDVIMDFLQYVYDYAIEHPEDISNEGWAMYELIELAEEYEKEKEKNV